MLGLVSGDITRSFARWDTTDLVGKAITSATVNFWNWWSPSCTAKSWEIWTVGTIADGILWANQPAWTYREATATGTKGFDATCGDGWVSAAATSFFQRAANAGDTRADMGIRATSETDGNAFKQFRSRNAADATQVPYAVVTYNSYPVIGTRSTDPASTCVTGTSRPTIDTTSPVLRAVVTDAESPTVTAEFEWWAVGGSKLGGFVTDEVDSGLALEAQVPTGIMVGGGAYSWRVRAYDGTDWSPFSSFCEFSVANTAPEITSQATLPSSSCLTGPERSVINTTTPQLKSVATDRDSATVRLAFEVWTLDESTRLGEIVQPSVPVDTWTAADVAAGWGLTSASSYKWRVQASDGGLSSPWSSWCEFTIDTSAPTITSSTYPENQYAGSPGTPGSFTFGPAQRPDVTGYQFALDSSNPDTDVIAAGGSATVTVTPASSGAHVLYVRSRDSSGVLSATVAYHFGVGTGTTDGEPDPSLDQPYVDTSPQPEATAQAVVCDNRGKKWFEWSNKVASQTVTHARRLENFTGSDMTLTRSVTRKQTITASLSYTSGATVSASVVVANLDVQTGYTLQAAGEKTTETNISVTATMKSGSGLYGVYIFYGGTLVYSGSYKYQYCNNSGLMQTLQSGKAKSWTIETDGAVRCRGTSPIGLAVKAKSQYCY
ncbi:hypothetical protein EV384_3403 [Micromonospora kangleipakensis]|uniref:Fibronectin type-III domain-containing protein n=1 Tax=Micromonospora kangleipakensis TaxID=1077942 RepID=A0A4Q8BCB9_9ACTN|nr:hypothetical protein [Micromonospora kangleipakensis]RZU74911.1 hypothetical protein EV384_3403 [Micromonospora kangleipakensis]